VRNVARADLGSVEPEQSLAALAPAPTLLPGESLEHYQLMRRALIADLAPNSAVEWLLTFDVIELSWEIERYRVLRQRILLQYREQAIEESLLRIDLLESAHPGSVGRRQIRHNARCWRTDAIAAREIETRLADQGIDQSTLDAECLAQAREIFLLFQALLDSAQSRRGGVLKEIKFHRSFRQRSLR
jgi:hypothetical protein